MTMSSYSLPLGKIIPATGIFYVFPYYVVMLWAQSTEKKSIKPSSKEAVTTSYLFQFSNILDITFTNVL